MKSIRLNLADLWRISSPLLLALCWNFGLLCGYLSATAAGEHLIGLLRQSISCSPSAPGLLAAAMLPFLLSAFAVSLSEPWLLMIISAFKAFSFSFCACGVSLAFGQSSWLVRFLFLFSDICLLPLLYFYWLRHISGNKKRIRWELPGCLLTAAAVVSIDYCLIAPFLVSVME